MTSDDRHRKPAPLEKPLEKLVTPLSTFTQSQASSGILLAIAVIAALALANSAYGDFYASLKHLHLSITLGDWSVDMSLKHWINDGLMVFFFFLLGLEIKRELIAGELRDVRQSSLVFCMAAGGMAVPALTYLGINALGSAEAARGWGIPMATDTAFALGILAVMGDRVPRVATVLLAALAIVDDIGAVLVISLFYTEGVQLSPLFSAALCLLLLFMLNLGGYRRPILYFLVGVGLWWFILQSGVHATTAGILAALAVPARPYAETTWFMRRMPKILRRFEKVDDPQQSILEKSEQEELAEEARQVAKATIPPLQRWERAMDMPVSLLIVPVFAFLNAGVKMPESITELLNAPVSLAVAAGLVVGKAVGVSLFAWLGIAVGISRMPKSMSFRHLIGLGCLAGIGFTMSLFINSLAFENAAGLQEEAKLGILLGSLIAAIAGTTLLLMAKPQQD